MNIAETLRVQAGLRPDAPAIIDGRGRRRVISFAALERASAQAARLLRESGLKAGDAVLVFQPMSQELYVALIALFRLGCIATFLDPSAGKSHIEACCAIYPPRALIAGSKAHLLRLIVPSLQRIPLKFSIGWPVPGAVGWHRVAHCEPLAEVVKCDRSTPALLTFTSGSTGQPKAALRTHEFLLAQHEALVSTLQLQPGTTDLTTLPVFLLSNLAAGVTSLIPDADLRRPGAIDGAALHAQIAKEQPRSIGAPPALLEQLAEYSGAGDEALNCLRQVFTGGAPVFPYLLSKVQAMAPESCVTAVYGSTEAEPIAHIAFDEMMPEDMAAMHRGSGLLAGVPVDCIQLRILPDRWGQRIGPFAPAEFEAGCLPRGQIGEIVVSGAHVLPGYLNGIGDGETKFDVAGVRWHRTGDAGYLDEQGRLWLLGRCAARIEDAYGTLYPLAVECAALEYSGVCRAALVRHSGQRVLVLEMRAGKEHRNLKPLLQSLSWANISSVMVIPRIPVDKRHNSKIDYPELERLLECKAAGPA